MPMPPILILISLSFAQMMIPPDAFDDVDELISFSMFVYFFSPTAFHFFAMTFRMEFSGYFRSIIYAFSFFIFRHYYRLI